MASPGIIVFISILVLIVLGLIVVLAIYLTKEEDEKEDKPHFMSFIRQGNGKAYGKVLSIEKAIDGRSVVNMRQQDLSIKSLKKLKKIESLPIIVDKGKLICLPKGTLSNEKDIYFGLPKNAEDFPENFGKTLFGKWLKFLTELKNVDNTTLEAYKECKERQAELIKKVGMGEATRESIQQFEGLVLDTIKNAIEVQKVKTSSSFPPIGQGINK